MFRAFACEPIDTAAIAETLINLTDFVKLCLIEFTLKLSFLLFSEVFPVFIDLITYFLTIRDELLSISLIFTVLDDLFREAHDAGHVGDLVVVRFTLQHQDELVLDEIPHSHFPVLEVNPDGDAQHALHHEVCHCIPSGFEGNENQQERVYGEARDEGHTPLKQRNLALLTIRC